MSDFKDRLYAEKTELDERKQKLDTFLGSESAYKIEAIQISLLNIQSQSMGTYSQCLLERIAWLEKTEGASPQ